MEAREDLMFVAVGQLASNCGLISPEVISIGICLQGVG